MLVKQWVSSHRCRLCLSAWSQLRLVKPHTLRISACCKIFHDSLTDSDPGQIKLLLEIELSPETSWVTSCIIVNVLFHCSAFCIVTGDIAVRIRRRLVCVSLAVKEGLWTQAGESLAAFPRSTKTFVVVFQKGTWAHSVGFTLLNCHTSVGDMHWCTVKY